VQSLDDYLCLDDIVCYDADGKPFEQYPKVWVKKDLERDDKGKILNLTSYEGASYFEKQGLFKPSFALTCAIIQRLYQNRNDPEAAKVLMTYQEEQNKVFSGWHGTNTMIKWSENAKKGSIIHYPNDEDYPEYAGASNKIAFGVYKDNINKDRTRIELAFDAKGLYSCELEHALKIPAFGRYIKNLTGLQKQEILIDVAKYFKKKAFLPVYLDRGNITTSTWLGCHYSNYFLGSVIFGLFPYVDLGSFAARGVSTEEPSVKSPGLQIPCREETR
jgi:hypothetical protein